MPAWHQRVRPCKSLSRKGSPARNERFEFGRHRWGANRPPAASGLASASSALWVRCRRWHRSYAIRLPAPASSDKPSLRLRLTG